MLGPRPNRVAPRWPSSDSAASIRTRWYGLDTVADDDETDGELHHRLRGRGARRRRRAPAARRAHDPARLRVGGGRAAGVHARRDAGPRCDGRGSSRSAPLRPIVASPEIRARPHGGAASRTRPSRHGGGDSLPRTAAESHHRRQPVAPAGARKGGRRAHLERQESVFVRLRQVAGGRSPRPLPVARACSRPAGRGDPRRSLRPQPVDAG
jgi:hypothetical protein